MTDKEKQAADLPLPGYLSFVFVYATCYSGKVAYVLVGLYCTICDARIQERKGILPHTFVS